MKNHYLRTPMHALRPRAWAILLFLLSIPFLGQGQIRISPNTGQNFGEVAIGSASEAREFTVTTTGSATLTTVSFLDNEVNFNSSVSFEGSLDGINFSRSLILPPAAGTTRLFIRFRPTFLGSTTTAAGPEIAYLRRRNGEEILNLVGIGTPGPPSIAVDPIALGFRDTEINTNSDPQRVTVTGTSLTTAITVTASNPAFQVSKTANGEYSSSINLTRNSDGTTREDFFVRFSPVSPGELIETITLTSDGATNATVQVSGRGVLPPAILTVRPNSLTFTPSLAVGSNSVPQSFTVSGNDLQGDVTIAPPSGFQIRVGTDLFTTGSITLPVTNGRLAETQVDVRFSPLAAQLYSNVAVEVTSLNATTQNVLVSGEGTPAPADATINVEPIEVDFGTITSSGSAIIRAFQVNATGLTDNLVLTPNSANIRIRNATVGGEFQNSALNISPVNGVVSTQTIEVQLIPTVARGPFSETISLASPATMPEAPAVKTVTVTANNATGAISDISLVDPSPTRTDYTFVTRPTTISAAKSILVSGTNLLQDLVVEPVGANAQYFEVSEDNVTFSRRLTFTPGSNGNVTQRLVYIRFIPGTAAVTVTAAIRATSAPALSKEVSVTGVSEPTLRLSQLIGDFGNAVVKNTVTAAKDIQVEGFLLGGTTVDLRFPQEVNTSGVATQAQYELSIDGGVTYVKSLSITLGPDGNFSSQLKVRYAPTRVGIAVQNLEYRNVSLNGGQFFSGNSGLTQATGFAIAIEPTAQSTASVDRPAGSTTATITFNLNNAPAGTSYGVNRLVIGTTTYTKLPTNLFPSDKQNFNPGLTDDNSAYRFGTGARLESGSNTFVVFNGASSSFTVSELDPNQTYYFYSFEYNDDGVLNAENYRVPNNEPLAPLPIELISFKAKLQSNRVTLNWVTASEKNNKGFEVQRSQNGISFSSILFRNGQGTINSKTSYVAVDEKPLAGVSYYRLKQIDFDGSISFSSVVTIINGQTADIAMYPNPVQNQLTIELPYTSTAGAQITITDLTGRVIRTERLAANGKLNMNNLSNGTYLVTVNDGIQKVTKRIVKN